MIDGNPLRVAVSGNIHQCRPIFLNIAETRGDGARPLLPEMASACSERVPQKTAPNPEEFRLCGAEPSQCLMRAPWSDGGYVRQDLSTAIKPRARLDRQAEMVGVSAAGCSLACRGVDFTSRRSPDPLQPSLSYGPASLASCRGAAQAHQNGKQRRLLSETSDIAQASGNACSTCAAERQNAYLRPLRGFTFGSIVPD